MAQRTILRTFLLIILVVSSVCGFTASSDSLQVEMLLASAKDKIYTQPDLATGLATEALDQARQGNFVFFEAKSLLYLGILDHIQSNYPEGIEHLNEALAISEEHGFSTIHGSALLNLGNIFYALTDAIKALEYFYKAEAFFEKNEDLQQLGSAYNNIAILLKSTGDPQKAHEYFKKALKLARQTDNETGIENARGNIAGIYLDTGDPERALEILLDQNKIFHAAKNTYRLAQNRYNIARAYAMQQKTGMAIDTITAAYHSYASFNNTEGMIGAGLLLAKWYLKNGEIASAEKWCSTINKISAENQNVFLDEVLWLRAEIQKANHAYAAATQSLEQLIHLNDTLQVQRYQDMVNIRQANFEVEKKQFQLEQQLKEQDMKLQMAEDQKFWLYVVSALSSFLLICLIVIGVIVVKMRRFAMSVHEKNKFIKAQLKQLENLNQSKNRMFSIIAHDLKSPLASMQPALRLISEDEVEKEEKEFLLNSLLQVVEISDFNMENILHWAQQQMVEPSTDLSTFSLNGILEKILPMYRLLLQFKQVDLAMDLEDDLMIRADQNQISFVVRNLIHNAIKFTYPGGKIQIKVSASGGVVKLIVKDNGQGMSAAQIAELTNHKRLKSTAGTSLETGSGLGLRLSIEYINQNHSSYTILSSEGSGTEFIVFFPGEKLSHN